MALSRKLKYLFFILVLGLFVSSCNRCDTSNPKGAADCMCNILEEAMHSIQNPDKVERLSNELDEVIKEVEEEIQNGSYTDEELEQAVTERNCMEAWDN